MAACVGCGTVNPEGTRFCGACAAPLSPVTGPVREERRVVTVLFCDLAGFTARAEALDPEDVRAFLVPYYDVLTGEIEWHGGHVDRFLGDGVMALFGAPLAHEDDPERAVRAALRILERIPSLGLDLHLRLGINTGEVLYAAATGERDDSVTGDAVNTAARLQAASPVDAVVVGEATYRATARLFRYEPLEPIRAKGKAEPVALWQPLAPIARRAGELYPEATPFVGRDVELALLVALFERARATPTLEIATILADAGLGKSRLVRELARHLEGLPDLVTWRVGRCLPYGDGSGLWALGEIVKAHAGIQDGDDQAAVYAKLDAILTEPDPSLRGWMKDRLGPLVGMHVISEPPQREEAFTAWRRFLESIARRGPAVLVVEDLHWADDTLVAFLGHLAEHVPGLPLLIVATARPELEERHWEWLSRTRRSTVLSLAALGDRDIATLLRTVLDNPGPELVAAALDRAAGSPLYAEQLAAMLRDRPVPINGGAVDEHAIPPSIAALLAARIDALPREAKAVLLDASVVGKTFWSGAVAALGGRERADLEPALAELVRRELVRPVFPSSMAGEDELTFWHALLRDVAYAELTRAARLARHRAAAAWITERAGTALGEGAEIVVAHLERALELATATGSAGDVPTIQVALVDALLAAAENALLTQASRSPTLLRRALELTGPEDPRRPVVLAQLGRALLATSDYTEATLVFEEAAAALRARGEELAAAELSVPFTIALSRTGEFERAMTVLGDARAVLEQHPGPALVSVLAALAIARSSVHDHPDVLADADRAIDLAASLGLPPPHQALVARGNYRWAADPIGSGEDLRAAIEGAKLAGDIRGAVISMCRLSASLAEFEGVTAQFRVVDEAMAFAVAHGIPTEMTRLHRVDGLLLAGAWDEMQREAEPLLAWALRHGDAWTVVGLRLALAEVSLERGEATVLEDDLAEMAGDVGFPPIVIAPTRADCATASHDTATARRLLASALVATTPGALRNDGRFVRACLRADALDLARRGLEIDPTPSAPAHERLNARAQVAEASGDLASARAGYEQVATELARLGYVPEHAYAVAGLGRCLLALGETERGIELLLEARATWERLRATPRLAEIDALLAAPPTPGPVPTPGASSRPPGV